MNFKFLIKNNTFIQDFSRIKNDNKIFLIGVLLSLSAPIISSFFLITSIFISFSKSKFHFLKNIFNRLLISSTFIIFISSVKHTFFNNLNISWQSSNSWVGLFRWLMMILIFCSLDNYVKTIKQKRFFSISLISGSIPLLITGIGQYYLNWVGPWYLFNGFITWYLYPVSESHSLMGIFSNPNYAGAWLVIITPFLIELFMNKDEKKNIKLFIIFITIVVLFAIYLTNSRNAYLGIIIILTTLISRKILQIFSFLSGIFIFSFVSLNKGSIINELKSILSIKDNINLNFLFETTRFEIYEKTSFLIMQRPIFGWGYSSFPLIYKLEGGVSSYIQHPHNIFLFFAYNYGFIFASFVSITISILIYKSFEKIYQNINRVNFINKAWVASTFVFLLMNLNDITYLDGRLSVISWILLAGTKSIANGEEL